MKKIIILHIFTFSFFMQGQSFRGLDKSPLDMVNFPASSQVQEKVLRVLYSRPQLKNRNLKNLIPNGKLWRTGANESTEITFFKDIEIGKVLINEEYPFAIIKYSNENFNKDLIFKTKNGSIKIFIPEWLKI